MMITFMCDYSLILKIRKMGAFAAHRSLPRIHDDKAQPGQDNIPRELYRSQKSAKPSELEQNRVLFK
ncbi:MAG: hypothetical protein CMK09_17980 [Ponticaulis sp.]|nr:hypothetical protein [Ponticaulis sp.]